MAQPGSYLTSHFPTYPYAYPDGEVPLSPLPKQLFSPPTDPYTVHHRSSPSSTTSQPEQPEQPQSQQSHHPNPKPEYAVWSRRPEDPFHAPGIIISTKAKPPPGVVQLAIELPTPPLSPTQEPSSPLSPPPLEPKTDIDHEPTSSSSNVPSSNVTESTDNDTPAALSPDSSMTSLSASMDLLTSVKPSDTPQTQNEAEANELEANEAGQPASEPSEPPSTSAPASSPPTPAPAPAPKKSWASLLTSTTTASSLLPGQKRLPTSSVVGISIPGSTPALSSNSSFSTQQQQSTFSHPALTLPHTKRTELLHLLTTPPPSDGSPTVHSPQQQQQQSTIRPRGLINAGNMCFANSVLQVLVYTPPFRRLFTELGRFGFGVRHGEGVRGRERNQDRDGDADGKEGKEDKGPTPLVDAMVEFVKEFSSDGRSASVMGAKGQQRDRKEEVMHNAQQQRQDEEDDDPASSFFLPHYVFDAMKEKTVFDGMRSGQQEDAEEFLGFFLDAIEEELGGVVIALSSSSSSSFSSAATGSPYAKKGKAKVAGSKPGAAGGVEEREMEEEREDGWLEVGKRNRMVVTRTIKAPETPITRIFGGKVRSTLKNPGHKDSVTVEAWRALRLDIQPEGIHTIEDAVGHMGAPQVLELPPDSNNSGLGASASIQHLLEALPGVLVVHLKRFCYDFNVKGVVKIGKAVRWGEELELGGEVLAPSLRKGVAAGVKGKGGAAVYRLFGVVYHHGHSASGGHYTLDVFHPHRHQGGSGWIRIDDEVVSDIRPVDVFAPDNQREEEQGKAAYLLFYRKVR